jgi:hypothetical protein
MSDLLPNKTLFTDSDACCEEKESDAAGELGFNQSSCQELLESTRHYPKTNLLNLTHPEKRI